MNPIQLRLTHHTNPVHGPWWRYRCICGITGGNRDLAAAHQKASRHAATCAAVYYYWQLHEAARHIDKLERHIDKLERHIADLQRANHALADLAHHAAHQTKTWQNSAAWLAHNP